MKRILGVVALISMEAVFGNPFRDAQSAQWKVDIELYCRVLPLLGETTKIFDTSQEAADALCSFIRVFERTDSLSRNFVDNCFSHLKAAGANFNSMSSSGLIPMQCVKSSGNKVIFELAQKYGGLMRQLKRHETKTPQEWRELLGCRRSLPTIQETPAEDGIDAAEVLIGLEG